MRYVKAGEVCYRNDSSNPYPEGSLARHRLNEDYLFMMIQRATKTIQDNIKDSEGNPRFTYRDFSLNLFKILRTRFCKNFAKKINAQNIDSEYFRTNLSKHIVNMENDAFNFLNPDAEKKRNVNWQMKNQFLDAVKETFSDFSTLETELEASEYAPYVAKMKGKNMTVARLASIRAVDLASLSDLSAMSLWNYSYKKFNSASNPDAKYASNDHYTYRATMATMSPLDPIYSEGNSFLEREDRPSLYYVLTREGTTDKNGVTYHDISEGTSIVLRHVKTPDEEVAKGQPKYKYINITDEFYDNEEIYNLSWLKKYTSPDEYKALCANTIGRMNPADVMPKRFNKYGEAILKYLDDNGYSYTITSRSPGCVMVSLKDSRIPLRVTIMDTNAVYDEHGDRIPHAKSNLKNLGVVKTNDSHAITYMWTNEMDAKSTPFSYVDREDSEQFDEEIVTVPLRYALGDTSIVRPLDGKPLGTAGVNGNRYLAYNVEDISRNRSNMHLVYDNKWLTLYVAEDNVRNARNQRFIADSEFDMIDGQEEQDELSSDDVDFFEKELNIQKVIEAARKYETDHTITPEYSLNPRIRSIQKCYFHYLIGATNDLANTSITFGHEFSDSVKIEDAIATYNYNISDESDDEDDEYTDVSPVYEFHGIYVDNERFRAKVIYSRPDEENGGYKDITEEEYKEAIRNDDASDIIVTYISADDDDEILNAFGNDAYSMLLSSAEKDEYDAYMSNIRDDRFAIVEEHSRAMVDYMHTVDFSKVVREDEPMKASDYIKTHIKIARDNVYKFVNISSIGNVALEYRKGKEQYEKDLKVWKDYSEMIAAYDAGELNLDDENAIAGRDLSAVEYVKDELAFREAEEAYIKELELYEASEVEVKEPEPPVPPHLPVKPSDDYKKISPVYSNDETIANLQMLYFDYMIGERNLPDPALSSKAFTLDEQSHAVLSEMLNGIDEDTVTYRQSVAVAHLQKELDVNLIGNYEHKFDVGHVIAYSDGGSTVRKFLPRAMYSLNMTKDNVLHAKEPRNTSICDSLIHFDEDSAVSLADYKAKNPDSFEAAALQSVYDTLITNGCTVNEEDIMLDNQGVIEYTAVRQYGQKVGSTTDKKVSFKNHIGQLFIPDEEKAGTIRTNYAASPNRVYASGYIAHIAAKSGPDDKSSMFERMRLIGYKQMMLEKIRGSVRNHILSESYSTDDDITVLNYVYHHMPNENYDIETFDRRWGVEDENGELDITSQTFRATIETLVRKIRLPNIYKRMSTLQAQAKIRARASQKDSEFGVDEDVDVLADDFVSDNTFDYRWWSRTGHNICEIASYADGYVDKDLTSTGTSQGAILYMTEGAVVNNDGTIIPSSPEDRTPLLHTEVMKYAEYDGSDRITMAGMQLMNSELICPNVKTALLPLNGWGYDDAMIVTKEFAENYQFYDSETGEMRKVEVWDKISDTHGNKGVISLIVDRDMTDEEINELYEDEGARENIRQIRDFFRQNPSLECVMSPYSGPSRNNGGTLRELYESEDKEPLYIPDRNGGWTEIPAGIGTLNVIITDKLGDRKSHIYADDYTHENVTNEEVLQDLGDENTREEHLSRQGRKLSAQLAMAFQSKNALGLMDEAYGGNKRGMTDAIEYFRSVGITLTPDGDISLDVHDDGTGKSVRLPSDSSVPFHMFARNVYAYEMNEDGTYKLSTGKGHRAIHMMETDENGNSVKKVIRTFDDYVRDSTNATQMRVIDDVALSQMCNLGVEDDVQYLDLPFPLVYPNEGGAVYLNRNMSAIQEVGDEKQSMTLDTALKSGNMEFYTNILDANDLRFTSENGQPYMVGGSVDLATGVHMAGEEIPSFRVPILSRNLRRGIRLADDSYMVHDYTNRYSALMRLGVHYLNCREALTYVNNYYVPNSVKFENSDEFIRLRESINSAVDDAQREEFERQLKEAKQKVTDKARADITANIENAMSNIVMGAQANYNNLMQDIMNDAFNSKYNVMRENLMSRRTKDSATLVLSPNPTLNIDEIGVPTDVMKEMGFVSGQRIIIWRDPILNSGNVRGMKVKELPVKGTGCSIHPLIDKSFEADYDGDTMALWHIYSDAAIEDASTKFTMEHNLADTTSGREGEHGLYLNDGMETTPNIIAHPEIKDKLEEATRLANEVRLGDLNGEDTTELAQKAYEVTNEYAHMALTGIGGDYISFESPQTIAEGVHRFSESGAKGNLKKGCAYLTNCVSINMDILLDDGTVVNGADYHGAMYDALLEPHEVDFENDMCSSETNLLVFKDSNLEPFDLVTYVKNGMITDADVDAVYRTKDVSRVASKIPELQLLLDKHSVKDFYPETAKYREETGITLEMRNTQQAACGIKSYDTALAGVNLQRFMQAFRDSIPECAMDITNGGTQGVLQSKHDASAAIEKDDALRYWSKDIIAGRVLVDRDGKSMSEYIKEMEASGDMDGKLLRSVKWKPLVEDTYYDKQTHSMVGPVIEARDFGPHHLHKKYRYVVTDGKKPKNKSEVTDYVMADKETFKHQLKAYCVAMESPYNEDHIDKMADAIYDGCEAYREAHKDEFTDDFRHSLTPFKNSIGKEVKDTVIAKKPFQPSLMNFIEVNASAMDKIAYGGYWRESYKSAKKGVNLYTHGASEQFKPTRASSAERMAYNNFERLLGYIDKGYIPETLMTKEDGTHIAPTLYGMLSSDKFSGEDILSADWTLMTKKLDKGDSHGRYIKENLYSNSNFNMTASWFLDKGERRSEFAKETMKASIMESFIAKVSPCVRTSWMKNYVDSRMQPFIEETANGKKLWTTVTMLDETGHIKYDDKGKPVTETLSFKDYAKKFNTTGYAVLASDWTTTGPDGLVHNASIEDLKAQYKGALLGSNPTAPGREVLAGMGQKIDKAVSFISKRREGNRKIATSINDYMNAVYGEGYFVSNGTTLRQAILLAEKVDRLAAREKLREMEAETQVEREENVELTEQVEVTVTSEKLPRPTPNTPKSDTPDYQDTLD